jgi:hypothetical protein
VIVIGRAPNAFVLANMRPRQNGARVFIGSTGRQLVVLGDRAMAYGYGGATVNAASGVSPKNGHERVPIGAAVIHHQRPDQQVIDAILHGRANHLSRRRGSRLLNSEKINP